MKFHLILMAGLCLNFFACKARTGTPTSNAKSSSASDSSLNMEFHCSYAYGIFGSIKVDGTFEASEPETRGDVTSYDNVSIDYIVTKDGQKVHISSNPADTNTFKSDHVRINSYITGEQSLQNDRTMVVSEDHGPANFKVRALEFNIKTGNTSQHIITPLLTLDETTFGGVQPQGHKLRSCNVTTKN